MDSNTLVRLKEFGLSEKEATVYLSLLELGSAPATELSEKSGVNRSSTYVVLDALQKHGLVSVSYDTSIKTYVAAPPERLLQLAEESAKKYTEIVGSLRNILPELKSVYRGTGPKPKVQFFEGKEGLISAYEDTLTSSEKIRAYASIENMHKAIPGYFPDYYQRRAANGITIQSIHPDTEESRERVKHNEEEAREALLVPKDTYNFSPEVNIYDNKIVFMSLVEKFALIIESVELADVMKKIFDLSWEEAKRLDKKYL